MNYRLVIKQLGILILLVAGCISSSLIWVLLDRQQSGFGTLLAAILLSVAICCAISGGCLWYGRGEKGTLYRKEALAIVGLGWFGCGLLGSLPFIFSGVLAGPDSSIVDICTAAIFESISGFTTTGASIFPEPETLPRAILFWRSLTHWLGGMGIIVLFVAILGQTGAAGKFLVSSEVPGPVAESVRPRIRQSALLLWKIYVFISAAEVFCFMVQGLGVFESLCHTFGTMATGGFSTLNGSIGQYGRGGIEITVIVFMVLAGTNFNLYAALMHGRWRNVVDNKEFRVYILLLVGATLFVTIDLLANHVGGYSLGRTIRGAVFQVVSIMTTTGYCTEDFNSWPSFSRWLLICLMFIGGSAGSTGGGIKVIRIMIFLRVALLEVERTFRPHVVRPLRIAGQNVDDEFRQRISAYVGLVLVIFFVATILLMVLQNEVGAESPRPLDLETAFSAVAATLNNIGPGLNMVGATKNYAFFTPAAKMLLALLMVLGRLEVMVILCLFVPNFWRRN